MPNTINSQDDASQRKKDIWVEQAIRPTLFIAIGGTGMEICMRLRRRILNHSWGPNKARLQNLTEFPIASFINFDLDSGSNIDSSKSQATDLQYELVKFAEGEKVVEAFNLDTYTGSEDALARYPHIEKWMPLTPRKIRELNIDPSIFGFIFAKIIYLIIYKSIGRIFKGIRNIRRVIRLICFFWKFEISIPFFLRNEWAVASCY
mgnify:CR=1 FL=1